MSSIAPFLDNSPMSQSILTTEPRTVTAGDTIKWQRTLPDYPASAGWVLKYALRGPSVIDITADDSQLVSVLSSASAVWVAGDYYMQGFVVKGSEQYTVYSGPVTVRPNLAAISGVYDGRSHVKRVLDAIEAVIEKRASKGDQQITIDGTMLSKMTAEQLMLIRNRYAREYRAELAANGIQNGKKSGNRILTRFV